MQKQAPTLPRLLTMVLFALSCFGLLLFLWLSFGGTVPLKPKGYRVNIALPEATQLGLYADVRVAGVSVGKVRQKQLDKHGNRTLATIQLDPRFAPLHVDAKATLRQKTLLGETYLELTPGTKNTPTIPEGGTLRNAQVKGTVQLDEIFNALDANTRRAFQVWQQSLAGSVKGRGPDLNDALGNLPPFAADASDVLDVLNSQSGAVRRLFRNTGVVFDAIAQNRAQLRNLVVNSGRVFDATSSAQKALAETFKIFPTFLDESKATLLKLDTFSRNTDPLIRTLRPVARDLRPTIRDVRAFAPDLKSFFQKLDPLITVSQKGLPALRDTLEATKPLLAQLDPFLSQLNPILQWLEYNQHATADFIANGGGALSDTVATNTPDEIGHYLRQFSPTGAESLAMYPNRPIASRGNAYLGPTAQQGPLRSAHHGMFPSADCANAPGGKPYSTTGVDPSTGQNDSNGPDCYTTPLAPGFQGANGTYLQVQPDNYDTGTGRRRKK